MVSLIHKSKAKHFQLKTMPDFKTGVSEDPGTVEGEQVPGEVPKLTVILGKEK